MLEILIINFLLQYYPNGTWCGWSCYLTGQLGNQTQNPSNISNTTAPFSALNNAVTNALPWFWPFIMGALYFILIIYYSDSPTQGKLMGITALVLVISFFMAITGLLIDATMNFAIFSIIFAFAWWYKL